MSEELSPVHIEEDRLNERTLRPQVNKTDGPMCPTPGKFLI